jgi:hypothetical protein
VTQLAVLPRTALDFRPAGAAVEANGTAFAQRDAMKWTGIYLVGYLIMLAGIIAALWKSGIMARIGTTWTIIGLVIAIGIGVMIAVANSGKKESINIER